MTDDQAPAGKITSRTLFVLLAISLSLNLLVAGMVVGQRLDGHGHRFNGGRALTARPGPYDLFVRVAPEPVLPFLKDAITNHQDLTLLQLQQLRAARRDALKQLKAQPFDLAAATAAFRKVRDLTEEFQKGIHETALAAYAQAYAPPAKTPTATPPATSLPAPAGDTPH